MGWLYQGRLGSLLLWISGLWVRAPTGHAAYSDPVPQLSTVMRTQCRPESPVRREVLATSLATGGATGELTAPSAGLWACQVLR